MVQPWLIKSITKMIMNIVNPNIVLNFIGYVANVIFSFNKSKNK
jgi:hypothetical protein